MVPATSLIPDLPRDTSRLLASRIDLYAQNDSSRTFASIPKSTNPEDGFRDISYAEFARAIDRASWWLDSHLAKSDDKEYKTFAFIGPQDLRYLAVIVASIKTGRLVFLPAPSLGEERCLGLLDVQNCKDVLYSTPMPVTTWFDGLERQGSDINTLQVPDFDAWFNDHVDSHIHYPYTKSWDEAIDKPIFTLHSSGTTGLPKLITYRNSTLVYYDSLYRLGQIEPSLHNNWFDGQRVWCPMSLFHLGGIYTVLCHGVYFNTIPVLSPINTPLSVALADSMVENGNIASAFYPPFLLEDIATRPLSLETVYKNLTRVEYGSAPLNRATGDLISKTLRVQPHYASTELPFPPYVQLDPEDWEYFSFHPLAGIEFCHRQTPDLFEAVVIRKPHLEPFQPCFTIMPNATSFNTGDLWSPHPTRPNLWRYRGRTDDIIVLSIGTNVHISPIESAIQEDPRIRAAVVGGAGKLRPFLLLELTQQNRNCGTDVDESAEAVIEDLWPSIDAVNEKLSLHPCARILKEYVVVAPAAKPFKRLGKGSVDRRGTIAEFEQEIDKCYLNGVYDAAE